MPGLCAADHFEVVDVMTLPPQAVLWKKIVAGHRAVPAVTFCPPCNPWSSWLASMRSATMGLASWTATDLELPWSLLLWLRPWAVADVHR